jgi:hypothetical protein
MDTSNKVSAGRIAGIIAGVLVLAGVITLAVFLPARKETETPPPGVAVTPPVAVPAPRQAVIWLSVPDGEDLKAGEEGAVEVRLDTKGQGMSAVHVVVAYDPALLEVIRVDGSGSVFPMEAVPPDALKPGRAEILRFIVDTAQQQGFRGFEGTGLVARLRVKPRNAGSLMMTLAPADTQYSPYGTAEEVVFSEVRNGVFSVQE